MFVEREIRDAKAFDIPVSDAAFELLPQALSQGNQRGTPQQALQACVESRRHASENRRSGSSMRFFAWPSQVQRDTCTASMPSCRDDVSGVDSSVGEIVHDCVDLAGLEPRAVEVKPELR